MDLTFNNDGLIPSTPPQLSSVDTLRRLEDALSQLDVSRNALPSVLRALSVSGPDDARDENVQRYQSVYQGSAQALGDLNEHLSVVEGTVAILVKRTIHQ